MESNLESVVAVLVAAALLVFAIGYRLGRSRRWAASRVVFLPAGQPIPIDSEAYGRIEEQQTPAEAGRRPKIMRWLLVGALVGILVQLIVALLLGVASYSYCRPQAASAIESSQTPELPVRPESPDALQPETRR